MSTLIGAMGEHLVADELKRCGHAIVALNWCRPRYEIDIVSTCNKTVYFTEVKTRSNSQWGSGLSYITKAKLSQMRFAAEMWLHEQSWRGEVRMLAAEVDSNQVVEIVELEF